MMTKIIYFFTIFLITIPAIADVVPNLNVATTSFVQGAMATKQDVIDSTHKLNADLVNDSSSTNKFVTANEKSTWNAKQNQLTNGTANVSNTVSTTVRASGTANDTTLVTEKAVRDAINATGGVNVTVDNTNVSANNPVPVVSNVASSNGTITVTRNDLSVPVKSNGAFNNTSVPIWFE